LFSNFYDSKQEFVGGGGGRYFDVLDDLRKAIITDALDPDTVEGDWLACLAFNLNVDSLSRLSFTKLLHAFHQYMLLQSSGRTPAMRAARAAW